MPNNAVLGFGSNLGLRLSNIKKAIKYLSLNKDLNLLALSPVFETDPWGYKDQNNFLNCAAVFLSRLSGMELGKLIKETEREIGRVSRGKWQAREIDIDILFFGDEIIRQKNLQVPHPMITERNFVLKPLVELMPGYIHPVNGKSIGFLFKHSKDKCKVKLYKQKI